MKLIKFVKENKIITFSLFVIVLAFIFLALPGQFAHYGIGIKSTYLYDISGYQFIFGTLKDSAGNAVGKCVGQGIAIFVMLILTVAGLVFSKKSSFVCMLTGLSLLVISILFFTISVAGQKVYVAFDVIGKYKYGWVPYLLGALILVAAGLVIYKTVLMMKDEIKHPTASNKGPTYNYLHK